MIPHLPTHRLTRHLLFWGGATLLAGSTYILEDMSNHDYFAHRAGVFVDLFLARLPTFVVYTYLLAYWIVPLLFRGQFIGFFVGLLLLNLAKWLLNDWLTYSVTFPLTHWLPLQQNTWLFGSTFPGITFWMSNIIAGLFICIKLFAQWQQKLAESQRLEREKLTQELELLKLQLNPTFLFSTLHSVQPLIEQHDKQAPEVIMKLAHLLRYVLYDSQSVNVLVSQEIAAIEQFVFLQQIVRPVGLEVSLTARGNLNAQSIAPLSLFPIVEQAFNQLPPSRADEPAWVSIDLVVSEESLTLKVVNPQPVIVTSSSKQLADIQKQLYFHYGNAYRLQVWQEERIQVVTLTLLFPTNSTEPTLSSALRMDRSS